MSNDPYQEAAKLEREQGESGTGAAMFSREELQAMIRYELAQALYEAGDKLLAAQPASAHIALYQEGLISRDSLSIEDNSYATVIRRLKHKYGYKEFEPFKKGSTAAKSAKVSKDVLETYIKQAVADRLIVPAVDSIGFYKFPAPPVQRVISADNPEQTNEYQILLAKYGRNPFNFEQACAAFKDAESDVVQRVLADLVKEKLAIVFADGTWLLERV